MASSLVAAMIGTYAARRNWNRTEPGSGPRLVPEGLASGDRDALIVCVSRGLVPRPHFAQGWGLVPAARHRIEAPDREADSSHR